MSRYETSNLKNLGADGEIDFSYRRNDRKHFSNK